MKKPLALIFLIITLLTGCGPASLPLPTTVSVTATITPSPTPSAIPTATPYPSLQTEGPYLLFRTDKNNFTIMDGDGIGRKYFQIPNDGYVWDLERAVSPDGIWLAYFTGSSDEPYDLALNLLDLSNEITQHVADLISHGFPENLEPVTKTIHFIEYLEEDIECSKDIACQLQIVQMDFRSGVSGFGWSPDSRVLAFSAQIDGPSSDIYLYNVEIQSNRRLTNEIENVGPMITWAPNGSKILYESSNPGRVYTSRYLHIANPEDNSLQNPTSIGGGPFWHGEGWINENSYLITSGGEGAPPHNFRYINIDSQQVVPIWKYSAESFFVDVDNENIFLLTFPDEMSSLQPAPEEGLYLVKFDGNYAKITNDVYIPIKEAGFSNSYFALQSSPYNYEVAKLVNIGIDGLITDLGKNVNYSYLPLTSPDRKWVIVTNDEGTYLYSDNLQLIKSWDIRFVKVIWRPDSTGAFLFSRTNLDYLSLNDKDLKLTDICPSQDCSISDYVWLP